MAQPLGTKEEETTTTTWKPNIPRKWPESGMKWAENEREVNRNWKEICWQWQGSEQKLTGNLLKVKGHITQQKGKWKDAKGKWKENGRHMKRTWKIMKETKEHETTRNMTSDLRHLWSALGHLHFSFFEHLKRGFFPSFGAFSEPSTGTFLLVDLSHLIFLRCKRPKVMPGGSWYSIATTYESTNGHQVNLTIAANPWPGLFFIEAIMDKQQTNNKQTNKTQQTNKTHQKTFKRTSKIYKQSATTQLKM